MVIFRRVSIGTSGQLPASDLLFYVPGLLSIELNVEPFTGFEPASIKGGAAAWVRFGPPPMGTLVARKLFETRIITVASPRYVAEHGQPGKPEEMSKHQRIMFYNPVTAKPFEWEFHRGKKVTEILAEGRLLVWDVETMLGACIAGAGIAQVKEIDVEQLMHDGLLMDLFPDWSDERFPLMRSFRPGATELQKSRRSSISASSHRRQRYLLRTVGPSSGGMLAAGCSSFSCIFWRERREKPFVARLSDLTRFCKLTDLQLVDLKAFSHANRQKMHEKDEHPEAEHHRAVDALQAQLGDARHQAGVLQGRLDAVQVAHAALQDQLAEQRWADTDRSSPARAKSAISGSTAARPARTPGPARKVAVASAPSSKTAARRKKRG
ncbi:LysR substrate-binding domain-containing protein [Paraburkholderia hospita]|uniref:LysR substrate-binding domain-containing protein n=1 Tax=Paraburkholderia hospita TaxID=169430 RepID=A0AAN1JMQ1_9BURK|nr:LysR substrate-binding domain-containing protein [Paraburkholderia hospita]AUT76605.1 hypothetical protein C2L64_51690 [Paraburkholderia hospita]SEI28519.1 LysR substrate binding domain-containing protein [Paraburkholderia hospita]